MRFILIAAHMVLMASVVSGADDENPFRKAKVGDWTEYKMTGPNVSGSTKMTIVGKDEKEVAYEITSKFAAFGQETVGPVQKIKVDLTKSYDPVVAANLSQNNTKIEKVGEGNEKLKVAGKEIETKWTKMKTTTTVNDMQIVSEYTMWISKDVPVSGLVKMETSTMGTATKLELVGSGNK
jgi:hypothetical protein